MLNLVQENEDLKHINQMIQLKLDEKELQYKGLAEDLEMAKRQLERIENQNEAQITELTESEESADDKLEKNKEVQMLLTN